MLAYIVFICTNNLKFSRDIRLRNNHCLVNMAFMNTNCSALVHHGKYASKSDAIYNAMFIK